MTSTIDQLPPNNLNSEQGLLGCCIFDGQNVAKAFDAGIKPEAFYDLRNRDIWHHLRMMDAASDHIDNVSLTQFSVQKGALDARAEAVYINTCMEQAPIASNIEYHVRLVREKWALRKILTAVTEAACAVFEPNADHQKIIGRLEQQLEEAKLIDTITTVSAKESTLDGIASIEAGQELRRSGQEFLGVPTGFRRLDKMSSGLPCGGLTVIGSRPSVGKTALLCNILQFACITNRIPTVVFSLETTHTKLMNRLASNFCDILASKLRDGDDLNEQEMKRLMTFAAKAANSPFVFAKDAFNCDSICSMIARHADMGYKLFLVDYVQIVGTTNRDKGERKTYAVGSVATALKQIAIKHDVTVVALAQLKRTDDEGTYPIPDDIADSDQIMRDADLLWLIHRPNRLEKPTEGCIIVAKNKDGDTGIIPMTYTPYFLRWEERKENPHDN